MGLAQIEVVWTDPPYGVSYIGGTSDALVITNDNDGAPLLFRDALKTAWEQLEPSCRLYATVPPGPLNIEFRLAFRAAGFNFHESLVWVKDRMVLGHSDYHFKHEDMLYGWKPGTGRAGRGNHKGTRWYGDHSATSVFEISRPQASKEHPTMKPVALVELCLRNSSQQGNAIYDPFLGSGTTLIACEKLDRICYGMEIEPRYVDVCIRRWETYTGKKAELLYG